MALLLAFLDHLKPTGIKPCLFALESFYLNVHSGYQNKPELHVFLALTTTCKQYCSCCSLTGITQTCTGANQSGKIPFVCSSKIAIKAFISTNNPNMDHYRCLCLIIFINVS